MEGVVHQSCPLLTALDTHSTQKGANPDTPQQFDVIASALCQADVTWGRSGGEYLSILS
jgi:hypothetical protein